MQQLINGLALGSVYALLGLGVTLVWGVLRVLNFAHAQLLTWGAFLTLGLLQAGTPVVLAVAGGMAGGAIAGVVVERVVIAALRRQRAPEFSYVVATIGVAFLMAAAIRWRTESQVVSFPLRGFPTAVVHIGSAVVPELHLVMLVLAILAMAALWLLIARTRFGRALRTVAYSPELAELLGVDSRAVYVVAFAISGFLAAGAGIFLAVTTATFSYSLGDPLLLPAFAVIIVGGMGSFPGAVVAGLLLGVTEVYVTAYISSVFEQVIVYALIFLTLLLRPSGLFGESETARA